MVHAYVMIKAHTGEADRLQREIGAVEGVTTVSIVAGDVDLIAKVNVADPAAVREVAATEIQNIDGVEDTHTYIAMD
ncbi:MAG: Lrp/AsnC family transcriptional regulator [Haloarculaceae archaeon]